MKKYILTLFFLSYILSACTNYKALYLQTRADLDECLSTEPKEQVYTDDVVIADPGAVQSDTIYISDVIGQGSKVKSEKTVIASTAKQPLEMMRSPLRRLTNRDDGDLQYEKQYQLFLNKDSVQVWVSVTNQLINQALIQTVGIDSLKYPKKKLVQSFTRIEKVYEYNRFKSMFWGVGSGLVIFVLFAIFYTKMHGKSRFTE